MKKFLKSLAFASMIGGVEFLFFRYVCDPGDVPAIAALMIGFVALAGDVFQ
jgi:hypothetical protein